MNYKTRVNQTKIDAVAKMKAEFNEYNDFIFADFRGVTVGQISELRRDLAKQNAKIRVIKNRYAKLALKDLAPTGINPYLVGPTAVALSDSDSSNEVAKTLLNFTKNSKIVIKGGYVAGSVFNQEQIDAYSKLPSRLELLSSLLGTMKAPIQNFVRVLHAVPTKLVRTLQAVADAKEEK